MKNKNLILNIIGLMFFVLFILGILLSGRSPMLMIMGLTGSVGIFYFIFRIVSKTL